MKTPVGFIIFNRPSTTKQVFDAIRKARPPLLLVVADGPRPTVPGDSDQCAAARSIIDGVDWDCEVRTHSSDTNLGCRNRVSSGLDWVFQQAEEAIILEDDCLPDPSFFEFCEQMLERYRHDERVGHIGGANLQFGRKRTDYSYYFSRYSNIWGWASWRRAWIDYDVDMKLWPELRDRGWLSGLLGRTGAATYWSHMFEKAHRREIDTWDYQRLFQCWVHGRLTILPSVNLISNIGYNVNSTHTEGKSRLANMKRATLTFPLAHPPFMIRDAAADEHTERKHYSMNYIKLGALVSAVERRLSRPAG